MGRSEIRVRVKRESVLRRRGGEGSHSPPHGAPGSAGGPLWLTPPGELFPPAFWQAWLSGLRSLRQKDEGEGWVVSQAQRRIPGGFYFFTTILKSFPVCVFDRLIKVQTQHLHCDVHKPNPLNKSSVSSFTCNLRLRDIKQQKWCVVG